MKNSKLLILWALLVIVTIPKRSLAKLADAPFTTVIKADKLKKGNCATPENAEIEPNKSYRITLLFTSLRNAKAALNRYQVFKGEAAVKGKQNGKSLDFDFGDPFVSTERKPITFLVNYILNPKKPAVVECRFQVLLTLNKKVDADKETAKVDYAGLAKELKFQVGLRDLFVDPQCCDDDDYPCIDGPLLTVNERIKKLSADLNKLTSIQNKTAGDYDNINMLTLDINRVTNKIPRNRLVYDAKGNEVYWFDSHGASIALSQKPERYFSVKSGDPVAFEIININPDAYKTSIESTSVSIFQEANAMLAKYLSPFSSSVINAAGSEGAKEAKNLRINVVRAAIITIDAALNDFFLNQSFACDNLHFRLIDNKIAAKRRIDEFLNASPINKSSGISIDEFMRMELNISKEDSTLYKVTKELYSKLPASSYHIERLTRARNDRDRIDFKYSILARDKTPFTDKAINEVIPVYIVGNWKVDVSAGLYFAPWMHDDKYAFRNDTSLITNGATTDTVDAKRIIRERNPFGEFGFSSYLHFYRKHSATFSWGGHLGAGVSLDDQIKPRYFAGLSFLFGRESGRIALNLGVAMGNVNAISEQYELSLQAGGPSRFKPVPSTVDNIQYVNRFKVAPSIGISYNLPFSLSKSTQTVPDETK